MHTVITGSGSFIPTNIKPNSSFTTQIFYDENRQLIQNNSNDIVTKFEQITGIKERRYADDGITSSCMAIRAAEAAISKAAIDAETIDQLIVAHNFGNIASNTSHTHTVPSLASLIKYGLGIKNSACVAYDILFGCPGWLQGLIQADAFTKAGLAKCCLIIGTETLSRVIDPFDRDSMIYSDGAGAVVTECNVDNTAGILGSVSASYANEDVDYIRMGPSNFSNGNISARYLKMQGRKVYEFALKHVPLAIKRCLDKCNVSLQEVKKIFIHQANEKMDEAIVKRLYDLCGIKEVPGDIMPMNIQTLGNSSVATIPTLYDMVVKGVLPDHTLHKNDIILFASVGAGMNINAMCYRV